MVNKASGLKTGFNWHYFWSNQSNSSTLWCSVESHFSMFRVRSVSVRNWL